MKRLIVIFILSIISFPTYADKVQGHFFCEEKFPDGSGGKFTIKVTGKDMSTKSIGSSFSSEYKEIYYSDYLDEQYTIFVMKQNTSQMIRILSPTENKNKITTTYINTATYREKSMVAHGICDRI